MNVSFRPPEHVYARKELTAIYAPLSPEFCMDGERWARDMAAAGALGEHGNRGRTSREPTKAIQRQKR